MKKIKWFMPAFFALALAAAPVFTSCGDDDDEKMEEPNKPDDTDDPVGPENPGEPDDPVTPDEPLTSLEQKQQLESTGISFLGHVKAADFQGVSDLVEYIGSTYEDYSADALDDWAENCLDAITTLLSKDEDGYWGYYDVYYYKRIYAASNFTGHFVAQNGRWVYSKANDLQFTVKDRDGKDCVFKLTTSGDTQRVYVGEDEEWNDLYDEDGYWYDEYVGIYDEYLEVPEKMTLTLTQGGKSIAKLVMDTDLTLMFAPDFDLESDKYDVTATLTVNGYDWKVEQAKFDANSSASLKAKMLKDGEILFSATASAKGDVSDEELGSLELNIDVLGEIQMKGTCSDAMRLADLLGRAEDNDDDEKNFKSYLNQANELIDLGVYYFGTSTKQASVKMEPFEERDYDYYYGDYEKYWTAEPVIYFKDGTSYSTFEAFFDEDSFEDLVRTFEKWLNSFEKLY